MDSFFGKSVVILGQLAFNKCSTFPIRRHHTKQEETQQVGLGCRLLNPSTECLPGPFNNLPLMMLHRHYIDGFTLLAANFAHSVGKDGFCPLHIHLPTGIGGQMKMPSPG